MTIRQEFEKALSNFISKDGSRRVLKYDYPNTSKEIALWAAKWMATKFKAECGVDRELCYEAICEIGDELQ